VEAYNFSEIKRRSASNPKPSNFYCHAFYYAKTPGTIVHLELLAGGLVSIESKFALFIQNTCAGAAINSNFKLLNWLAEHRWPQALAINSTIKSRIFIIAARNNKFREAVFIHDRFAGEVCHLAKRDVANRLSRIGAVPLINLALRENFPINWAKVERRIHRRIAKLPEQTTVANYQKLLAAIRVGETSGQKIGGE
jgi:hypothetical protein